MKISEYFKTAKGTGVLATADDGGRVNVSIYAVPHVMDEETIAFIMADRLTHQNLQSNPNAAYLFMEEEEKKYKGKRLYLKKIREEKDSPTLDSVRRKKYPELKGEEYLVYFRVEKVLPLIGSGPEA
jgi:hypothetical protein